MIHYSNCPVCKSNSIAPVFSAKDYTVSNELFEIWECDHCTLRFTQNIPLQENIVQYYQASSYVSHTDSKEGPINKLYHVVRSFTLYLKRLIVTRNAHVAKGNLLDIGSGTGAFLNTIHHAGWSVAGLEPDEMARKKSTDLYGITPGSPEKLFELKNSSYDVITMWHVLEHVHQLHEYISTIKKTLKLKGVLFIAVPNYTSFDANKYKELWAAYDVPRHLYHFSPKSMKILLKTHGLVIDKIKPMWFDSFYVSMLSEQNKSGSLFIAFLIGCWSNVIAFFRKDKCSSLIYVIKKA